MHKGWIALIFLLTGLALGVSNAYIVMHKHDAPAPPVKKKAPYEVVTPEVQAGVALHEAGHAIAGAYLMGPAYVNFVRVRTSKNNGTFGDAYFHEVTQLDTAEDMFRDVVVYLAGRAADDIFNKGPTDGAYHDLSVCTNKLLHKHLEAGMGDSLAVRGTKNPSEEIWKKVEAELNDANACAEAILVANAALVKIVADATMDMPDEKRNHTLSGDAFRELVKATPMKPVERVDLNKLCALKK